jgi:prophage antirepressor-like protein
MLTLQTLDGKALRAHIDAAGGIWWVVQDVCDVLGLANVSDAVAEHPANEKNTLAIREGMRGNPLHLLVNEPGLYRLIFRSRKPEAEAFKCWVFTDVLPTLRRTGHFRGPPASTLTVTGQLPAAPMPRREYHHVSLHLLSVWALLRESQEWLEPREIAHRTAQKVDTVRKHVRYLTSLGLIEKLESYPSHHYHVSADADMRNPGVFHRLNHVMQIMMTTQQRQIFGVTTRKADESIT